MNALFSEIDGYKEAVESENRLREFSFLDYPDLILDVKVKPLTPRLFSLLHLKKTPILCGGDVAVDDILLFLWIVSFDFNPQDETKRKELVKQCLQYSPDDLYRAIADYIEESFQDSTNTKGLPDEIPYYHWIASLVVVLASEFHWSEREILDMPFKRLWQYLRCISKKYDSRAILFNKSDKLKSDWLCRINEEVSMTENNLTKEVSNGG